MKKLALALLLIHRISFGSFIIGPTQPPAGGGGGGSWGSITGTLSDQTDLQSALDLKAPLTSPTFATSARFGYSTASRVPYLDANKDLIASSVTPTELGYVSGVTSAIQTQLDGKASVVGNDMEVIYNSGGTAFASEADLTYNASQNTLNSAGKVLVGDGAVGGPSFGFINDSDTGFYSNTANEFSIAQGGSQKWQFEDNGSITGKNLLSAFRVLEMGSTGGTESSEGSQIILSRPGGSASNATASQIVFKYAGSGGGTMGIRFNTTNGVEITNASTTTYASLGANNQFNTDIVAGPSDNSVANGGASSRYWYGVYSHQYLAAQRSSAGDTPPANRMNFYAKDDTFFYKKTPAATETRMIDALVSITTPTAVALTADDQAVTTTSRSFITLTSDNATPANRTFTLGNGTSGQRLTLMWNDGTNAGELADTGNQKLSAAWSMSAAQYSTLDLIYDGTNWVELARSTN